MTLSPTSSWCTTGDLEPRVMIFEVDGGGLWKYADLELVGIPDLEGALDFSFPRGNPGGRFGAVLNWVAMTVGAVG